MVFDEHDVYVELMASLEHPGPELVEATLPGEDPLVVDLRGKRGVELAAGLLREGDGGRDVAPGLSRFAWRRVARAC